MPTKIDGLTSARAALGTEVQAIGAHAARLPLDLAEKEHTIEFSRNHQNMDASNCTQEDASKGYVMDAETKLHPDGERFLTMAVLPGH
jgi:hypothetical protein